MGIGLNGLNSGLNDTYSALLGGGAGAGEVGGASLLSDYASIKNGSYGKMMKSSHINRPPCVAGNNLQNLTSLSFSE